MTLQHCCVHPFVLSKGAVGNAKPGGQSSSRSYDTHLGISTTKAVTMRVSGNTVTSTITECNISDWKQEHEIANCQSRWNHTTKRTSPPTAGKSVLTGPKTGSPTPKSLSSPSPQHSRS